MTHMHNHLFGGGMYVKYIYMYVDKKQVNSVQLAHRKMIRNLEEEKMKQRLDLAEQQLEQEMKKQHVYILQYQQQDAFLREKLGI